MTWEKPKMVHGEMTKYGWVPYYPKNITLGERVDIGFFSFLQAQENIWIGDDVQIGGGCFLYSVDTEGGNRGAIIIQKGAKIGSGTRILPGCNIGHHAVIGALSVLQPFTQVPPNEMWAGCPAKRKKGLK